MCIAVIHRCILSTRRPRLTRVELWVGSGVFSAMKAILRILFAGATSLALLAGAAHAAPRVGQAAPDFTLTDITGATHTLSAYKGKTVVLEWVNPECPFVMKHYQGSGNIPATQKAAVAEGAIWLSINSGRPGSEGDYDAAA